jgi:hypothetical protein
MSNETVLTTLSPEQLASWKRDGFLFIKAEDFWAPEQIENLKKVPRFQIFAGQRWKASFSL